MLSQAHGDILGLACDEGADLVGVVEIDAEGVLVGNGLGFSIDADGSIIDPASERMKVLAVLTHSGAEGVDGHRSQITDGSDPESCERPLGAGPDAGEPGDMERVEDLLNLIGLDDEESVGFVHIGGELGEELVWRHADGAGELGFIMNESADLFRDVNRRPKELERSGDIEEGLIDGDGLDRGREPFKDFEDLARNGLVIAVTTRHNDRVWAESERDGGGLSGVASVFSCFVGSGGDDAAWS